MESSNTAKKILEAAEEEFLTRGYAGARTTSIAQAAGVTHAMLHYYFRTKKNLFEQVIADKFEMLGQIMGAGISNPEVPLMEKIPLVIEQHLDFIAAHPTLPRFMTNEVFTQPEYTDFVIKKIESIAGPALEKLQLELDECAARGECRKVDASMLLLDIVSLNIFSFIAQPVMNAILGDLSKDMDAFLAARKKENVDTILRKLKV